MEAAQIVVIAHDIRSAHNVGSIFRSCDGFGIKHLYLSGYTAYPKTERDTRLPHIVEKSITEIAKTALGAEKSLPFSHISSPHSTIDAFKAHGYQIIGLQQDDSAAALPSFTPENKLGLVLGEEINGISSELRKKCDVLVEIPMSGKKDSFNVSVATGIALYSLLYHHAV